MKPHILFWYLWSGWLIVLSLYANLSMPVHAQAATCVDTPRFTLLQSLQYVSQEEAPNNSIDYRYTTSDVVWSPDNQSIALNHRRNDGGRAEIRVWNLLTGESQFLLEMVFDGHPVSGFAKAWSPDGKYLAFTTETEISILRLSDNQLIELDDSITDEPTVPIWSPDGSQLAAIGFEMISIWEVGTGKKTEILTLEGSLLSSDAIWSEDYGLRWTTRNDDYEVSVWSQNNSTPLMTRGLPYPPNSWRLSPQGNLLATGFSGTTIRIEDVNKGQLKIGFGISGNRFAFSSDEKCLALITKITVMVDENVTTADQLQIWSVEDGRLLQSWNDPTRTINQLSWSPDGQYLAYIDGENVVKILGVDH